MKFNATMEFDVSVTAELADQVVDQLASWAAAAETAPSGYLQVTITLDADSVAAATRLTLGLAGELDFSLSRVEVLSTTDFDRRLGLGDLDDVVSVAEAASELGVSAQAIRQRLEAGTLAGRKAGRAWHVSRGAVLAAKARQRSGTRIRRRPANVAAARDTRSSSTGAGEPV